MSTLQEPDDRPTATHAHRPSVAIEGMTDRCPLCGQPVTKEEYTRIIKQIEARVQRQAKAEAETARSHAEQQIKAALENQEKIISKKLQAQRFTLEKAKSSAVSAEMEKLFR
jgi:hypothetical protein